MGYHVPNVIGSTEITFNGEKLPGYITPDGTVWVRLYDYMNISAENDPLGSKYSGKDSHAFWAEINSLNLEAWDRAYLLGVVLQDFEADILSRIRAIVENAGVK